MAPALENNTTLGVTLPGVPRPEPVEEVSDFERLLARNLRQTGLCGREWVRRLIDDPSPEAEAELAKLIADSGGRAIRHNEAGMLAQMRAAADRAEVCRRAVETVASNAAFAPADYPPELRAALEAALGRVY